MEETPSSVGIARPHADSRSKSMDSAAHFPDISTAASAAVIGTAAMGERSVAIGGDVQGVRIVTGDSNRVSTVPYDAAFERIAGTTAFVRDQLEQGYKQTREQAEGWFRFSLVASAVGFALIGIGVVLVALGRMTPGIIAAVASAVPDVAAALFFVQSRAANQRVDTI